MLTLYDAARCPYCARTRIVLAEKGLAYEAVEIDLRDRPAWLYDKNPSGRVPVLEESEGLVLPESLVIDEYLEERFPEPPLLPVDPAERALARYVVHRFDALIGGPYYRLRRGEDGAAAALAEGLGELDMLLEAQPFLTGRGYGLADIAYLPWLARGRSALGVDLGDTVHVAEWFERLAQRPAIAAELELVAAL